MVYYLLLCYDCWRFLFIDIFRNFYVFSSSDIYEYMRVCVNLNTCVAYTPLWCDALSQA
jgi:hypothetical protein